MDPNLRNPNKNNNTNTPDPSPQTTPTTETEQNPKIITWPNPLPEYTMIEKVISDLGLVAAECRSNSAGYWEVVKGSAKIWIGIYQAQSDQKYYFEVLSGVMQVPQNNAGNLALDLLALTHGLVGVAFTIYQGHIYLRGSRELEGLDEKEALNILTRVGSIADNYDEELQKKYPHQRSIGYIPSSTK